MLPNFDDVIKSEDHRYEFYKIFVNVIEMWCKENTKYIKEASLGKTLNLSKQFIDNYNHNLESFVLDFNGWNSKESKRISVNIFVEIARTNFLLMYNEIKAESDEIKKLEKMPEKNYKVLWYMEKSNYFYLETEKLAIMMYKQSDVIKLLLHLTQMIDYVESESFDELEFIVNLLQTRNGIFFCQEIENDAKMTMEEYATFCTIYFNALYRRMFYYRLVPKGGEIDCGAIKFSSWFEQNVMSALGSEGFEDLYAKACEECYHFPGDTDWFKFRYPELPVQTGPILDSLRKEMAKKYYTDYRISKESALGVYNQSTHAGQCSRIFILNAIDHYMKIHFNIPWRDGIVIKNDGIEGSKRKLMRKGTPYIVQMYSRFAVYDDSKIYTSNDIYKVFGYWCKLVKEKYKSEVFGTNFKNLLPF